MWIHVLAATFEWVRSRLVAYAERRDASGHVLERLAELRDDELDTAIGMNPQASAALVRTLLERTKFESGSDIEARKHILGGQAAPLALIWKHAQEDPSAEVRVHSVYCLGLRWKGGARVTAEEQLAARAILEGLRGHPDVADEVIEAAERVLQ